MPNVDGVVASGCVAITAGVDLGPVLRSADQTVIGKDEVNRLTVAVLGTVEIEVTTGNNYVTVGCGWQELLDFVHYALAVAVGRVDG